MINLLTGLALGLVFGVPVGVAGIMSMQRTLTGGPTAGFITGIGSSLASCLYIALGFLASACFLRLLPVIKSQLYLWEPYWLWQSGSSDYTISLCQSGLPNELIAEKAMLTL